MYNALVGLKGFEAADRDCLMEVLAQLPDVQVVTPDFLAKNNVPDMWLTPDTVLTPIRLETLQHTIQKKAFPAQVLVRGTMKLEAYLGRVYLNDVAIELTDIEAGILARLMMAEGRPVSRHILLAGVWGVRSDLETHTLETHIYRLRQKIEQNPSLPAYVLTDVDSYRIA